MEKRNVGMIATGIAVLLCGCPGLFSIFFGAIFALVSVIPGADINIAGSSSPTSALLTGLGACCGGLLFVAIPVIVGFVLLRNKPVETLTPASDEPLPPAS